MQGACFGGAVADTKGTEGPTEGSALLMYELAMIGL